MSGSSDKKPVSARQGTAGAVLAASQNAERIITIFVGEGEKTRSWAVHAAHFSSQSPILKKEFDAPDATSKPGVPVKRASIRLPKEDPDTFNLVRNWVYAVAFSGRGTVPKIDEKEPDPDIEEVKVEEGETDAAPAPATTPTTATPREVIDLYVLADKFDMIGLKNACVDALYTYYHGPEAIYMVADDGPQPEGRKPRTREIRRCPNLRDVKYVFDWTSGAAKKAAKIRQLLIVSVLFFLFSRRGVKRGLPAEWQEVLSEKGEIGFEMIWMIATWNWVLGENAPSMKVKDACTFHDGHEHGVTGPCGSVQIYGQVSLH